MQLLPSFLGCSERDVVVHMPSTGSRSYNVFETRSPSHPHALWIPRAAEPLSRVKGDAVDWTRSVHSAFISTRCACRRIPSAAAHVVSCTAFPSQ
jgi:hypothetical protein